MAGNIKYGLYIILMCCCSLNNVIAQTQPNEDSGQSNWKVWTGVGLGLQVTKKSTFSIALLQSNNIQDSLLDKFNQGSAALDYDFNRKFSMKAGIVVTQFPSSGNTTYRYYIKNTYKSKLGKNLNWWNGIQFEKHSKNENRFDYRVIYSARFAPRKRLEFMHLLPSVSYSLYYNIGGSKIQYYDSLGEKTIRQTPDGLHRGRLNINLSSKVSDLLSVSLYYINQIEFNFMGNERGLNVLNPSTGKVTRPFNNYNVAGLSLLFNIDL